MNNWYKKIKISKIESYTSPDITPLQLLIEVFCSKTIYLAVLLEQNWNVFVRYFRWFSVNVILLSLNNKNNNIYYNQRYYGNTYENISKIKIKYIIGMSILIFLQTKCKS